VAASMSLEDQFDRLAKHHEIAIFCSFVMEQFQTARCTHGCCPRLGQNHSHLIPVEDYARPSNVAVGDALRQTVGVNDARVLEQQASLELFSGRSICRDPRRLLLALRESLSGLSRIPC